MPETGSCAPVFLVYVLVSNVGTSYFVDVHVGQCEATMGLPFFLILEQLTAILAWVAKSKLLFKEGTASVLHK